MISVQSLQFVYPSGGFELDIADFSVASGEKVALVGPSGSGKTTLLNLISGIISSTAGTITVDQTLVSELSDAERRAFRIRDVGFIFQDFELLDYLNVMDNIVHAYRISPALSLNKEVKERAKTLAQSMGIGNKLKRHPDKLSQGEKQRVAICRALLNQPKLILADEPTGNLDPENKTRIIDLLCKSVDEQEATLIAVTHDHELLKHFDRVVDFAGFRLKRVA